MIMEKDEESHRKMYPDVIADLDIDENKIRGRYWVFCFMYYHYSKNFNYNGE